MFLVGAEEGKNGLRLARNDSFCGTHENEIKKTEWEPRQGENNKKNSFCFVDDD